VEEFLERWSYLGIALGIIATGVGFPMPEELPIVIGGALVGGGTARGWIMLPVCIVSVIVGDSLLYGIGRRWGPRLLRIEWVRRRLLPPERLEKIEKNFQEYGVQILLFARVTPGIRAPIFLTAGMTRLPLVKFLLADGLYAVPGVTLLFFLGYWFGDAMIGAVHYAEQFKPLIVTLVLLAVGGYVLYRFLRKPMVTGDPKEMPPIVGPVTQTLEHTLEQVTHKILHPGKSHAEAPAKPELPRYVPLGSAPAADGKPPGEVSQPQGQGPAS
jgi:membrane protein DedA with SNARE-associated domain